MTAAARARQIPAVDGRARAAGRRRGRPHGELQAILDQHDMLRLRVRRSGQVGWGLQVLPPGSVDARACFRVADLEPDDVAGAAALVEETGRCLDPESGRMLQAVWLRGSARSLFLAIHHLAIDGVSSRQSSPVTSRRRYSAAVLVRRSCSSRSALRWRVGRGLDEGRGYRATRSCSRSSRGGSRSSRESASCCPAPPGRVGRYAPLPHKPGGRRHGIAPRTGTGGVPRTGRRRAPRGAEPGARGLAAAAGAHEGGRRVGGRRRRRGVRPRSGGHRRG